jgi:hypothetical protein
MEAYSHIHMADVRVFTESAKATSGFGIDKNNRVRVVHMPTGLEVVKTDSESPHVNRLKALIELNEMVNCSDIRFFVAREYSGVTAKNTLLKLCSRGFRTDTEADDWMVFCEDQEPKHKGKFFVFKTKSPVTYF